MSISWKKRGALLLLGTALFTASGCQAVGGLELNKALEQQASVKSGEASGSISLELIPGPGTSSTDEEKSLFDLMRSAKLTLSHVSVQDASHLSVEGEFTYGRGTIPFHLSIDGDRIVMEAEGANKPIVLTSGAQAPGAMPVPALTLQLQEQLRAKSAELSPLIAKFLFPNVPNPAKLDVSGATETVHGQTMSLQKVHAELSGSELKDLLIATIRSIAKDEAGLKELIGGIYDLFVPLLKESIRQENEKMSGSDNGSAQNGIDMATAYLDNKTLAVEFLYTTLRQYLDKAVSELDKGDATANPGAGSAALLNEKTQLKADLYVDSSLNVRKQRLELYLTSPDDQPHQLAAVRITTDMELWNQNEKITGPSPDVKDALVLNNGTTLDERALLGNFKSDSLMYRLLKDDLHITRKRIYLLLDGESGSDSGATHPYIDESGVTMVPARFLAERLGADVKWDEATKSIYVSDAYAGTDIEIALDSTTVYINGKQKTLVSPAVLKEGTTFVPLRFIAEALHAKVDWDSAAHRVTVERD